MVSIALIGADAMAAKLLESVPRALVGARSVASLGGHIIESNSKATTPVDTGALRRSIGVHYVGPLGMGYESKTSPTMFYSAYVEYGTQGRRPNPYMHRGLAASGGAVTALAAGVWGQVF